MFYTPTKTSLLCRLQAQTLPNATPPICIIHLFNKSPVTFEPAMSFLCPSRLKINKKKCNGVYLMTQNTI